MTDKPELVPSLAARKKQANDDGVQPCPPTQPAVNDEDLNPVKCTRNVVNDIKRRRLGKIITGNKPGTQQQSEEIETEV